MPKPDQDLLDGHFEGEHEAHNDVDHKVLRKYTEFGRRRTDDFYRSTSFLPVPTQSTQMSTPSQSLTRSPSSYTTTT